MRIIAVQMNIDWEDRTANFARVQTLLEQTPVEKNSLIVLPEMFASGFSMNVSEICEGADRPPERFLAELARRYNAFIIAGVVTKTQQATGRNEAVILDPDGTQLARYAKLHPFSYADANPIAVIST